MTTFRRKTLMHSRGAAMVPVRNAAFQTAAFTLVELLLSMTILSVLMLVVVNVIGIVQQQWTRANSKVTSFREARMAFDLLNRNLSQATLNAYWTAKENVLGVDAAQQQRSEFKSYMRQSELQFVCGKTINLLDSAKGDPLTYPGHGVFFQAPLGVTRLVTAVGTAVDTENMVNLLCGRGYYVAWGDDAAFRPAFLDQAGTVSKRFRYRLMEYSPTAEANQIYYDPAHAGDLAHRLSITLRSKRWFQDAGTAIQSSETRANRAFTRPVADNIIALIISPQTETAPSVVSPESIAPFYEYDSTVLTNLTPDKPQGTQHLLPPLLKVTMVSLDSAAGERLAEAGNTQQQALSAFLAPLFANAAGYNNQNSNYHSDLSNLESFLVQQKLNYRIFTTTVIMKQAGWSH